MEDELYLKANSKSQIRKGSYETKDDLNVFN